jgi:hypothetical protein
VDRRCRLSGLRRPTRLVSKALTNMGRKTLFDSIPRRGGPAAYSEAHFTFLNRVDGPAWQRVRDLLEGWYAEAVSRLRS